LQGRADRGPDLGDYVEEPCTASGLFFGLGFFGLGFKEDQADALRRAVLASLTGTDREAEARRLTDGDMPV
jgi:hypothetical protein